MSPRLRRRSLMAVLLLCLGMSAHAYLLGDVDRDGKVTILDAVASLRIATGLALPDAIQLGVGDIDRDQLITAADAVPILRAVLGLVPLPNRPQVVFDGNSLTAGYGLPDPLHERYSAQVERLLPMRLLGFNVGILRQTTGDMLAHAASFVDPIYSPEAPSNIVVVWEGTNDLYFGATPELAFMRLVEYARGRRAAGFKVVILTLLPRSLDVAPSFEPARIRVNDWIRGYWRIFADGLADVAADDRLGLAGDELNPAYYLDRVHLTAAGYGLVSQRVAQALLPLLSPERADGR